MERPGGAAPAWRPVTLETPSRLRPPAEVQLLFARVVEAHAHGEAGVGLATTLCHQLLLTVADACCPSAPPDPLGTQRTAIQRALTYLHRHYAQPLSLLELGEAACLHPAYFGALFKRHTGATPVEYLHRLRVEAARSLLRADPERTVSSIAAEVGFTSLPHFHRIFKRLTGVTPDAYRRG